MGPVCMCNNNNGVKKKSHYTVRALEGHIYWLHYTYLYSHLKKIHKSADKQGLGRLGRSVGADLLANSNLQSQYSVLAPFLKLNNI